MAFDGITIANLTYELQTILVGGRISKISMPNKDELIFTIKNNSHTYRLLLSASASLPLLYLTSVNKQSPMVSPAFCMLLRKHIGNAKIRSISQLGLERIVCFELEHLNDLGDISYKKIYMELMGKHSNIIFTDENDAILDSIKRVSANMSSIREILPNRTYFLPKELTKNDLLSTDFQTFSQVLSALDMPLSKVLYSHFSGISPLLAQEIITRANLSEQIPSNILNEIEKTHLFGILQVLLEDVKNKRFSPNIIYKENEPIEFASIHLSTYTSKNYHSISYTSISELLFDYYQNKDTTVRIRQKSADLRRIVLSALERSKKKYSLQKNQLLDASKKEKYKVYGDLLNTYGYTLAGGEKSFTCENFYDENKSITIPLDEDLSAKDNAKRYYDKYTKLKRTEEALSSEIGKTRRDVEHLSSIQTALELTLDESALIQIREELSDFGYIKKQGNKEKQKTKSKALHFISSDGYDIYVGKNNYQNEEITFKLASGNDWWFHAKHVAGSHVIVKSKDEELPDRVFEEAGALAAYYSKNKDVDKVEVDYIQRKNLKRVPSAPPGFVIYHENWSLIASPNNQFTLVE